MSSSSDYQAYILARCKVDPVTNCWNWQLGKTSAGYGAVFKNPHKITTAHRLAYYAFTGELIAGLFICHKCDNRICVNPAHLVQETPKWNMKDKVAKGRLNPAPKMPKGILHPAARLSEADILTIRSSSKSQVQLGLEFGISQSMVSRIKARNSWRHI